MTTPPPGSGPRPLPTHYQGQPLYGPQNGPANQPTQPLPPVAAGGSGPRPPGSGPSTLPLPPVPPAPTPPKSRIGNALLLMGGTAVVVAGTCMYVFVFGSHDPVSNDDTLPSVTVS